MLPDPPVDADAELSGFGFMLDVDRLLASELVALGTPEECWAAMMLWCRAWKQRPPSSLPNDDRVLASFSGTGKRWPKVKAMALRGFVQCSDGRFYHHVLADAANDAWKRRQEHVKKRDRDADRLRQWREKNGHETPRETRPETVSETPTETRSKRATKRISSQREQNRSEQNRSEQNGTEQTEVQKQVPNPKVKTLATAASRRPPAEPDVEAPSVVTWAAYSAAYLRRYGVEPTRNAKVNGQLANLVTRLGAEEAPLVAAFYLGHNGQRYVRDMHSVGLLLNACEGLRTEWARGRIVTETEARQADRTAALGNAFGPLIAEAEAEALEAEQRNGTEG